MLFPDTGFAAKVSAGRHWIDRFVLATLTVMLTACGGGGSGGSSDDPSQDVVVSAPQDVTLNVQAIKTFRFDWTDVPGATHYQLLENPDGLSDFAQVVENIPQGTETVDLAVPLYTRVNAQYVLQACNASGCVASDPVSVSGNLEEGIGYFKASNTGSNDSFGRSVSLSADGMTLAVGADGEDSSATGINGDETDNAANSAGAVYVFTRTAGGWSQAAYFKASNTDAGDYFGTSLSLSADGMTLAVGADGEASSATGINGDETDNGANGAGAVYVFTRTAGGWGQADYLKASNAEANDRFGRSLSLSADGMTLAVGAWGEASSDTSVNGDEADNDANNAGAVYLFTRTAGGWSQAAYFKASNAEVNDYFGSSLNLSADGSTLAVGADGEDSSATGVNGDEADNDANNAGAVYVFTRTAGGWTQAAYLKASNAEANDYFGNNLSLGTDGTTLAVGALGEASSATVIAGDETDNSASRAGAVYVFTRTAGGWSQEAYLKASNAEANDYFGISLSLSADGMALAVGADSEGSSANGVNGGESDNAAIEAGAVYVFTRAAGGWSQTAYLKASKPGVEDYFGTSLSLSADGSTLAVGADDEDSSATGINGDQSDNAATSAGAVYVY